MAVITKCRSCRAIVKDPAMPCPACGSVDKTFFVRYYPEGRNGKRSWYPLEDTITTIDQARGFDEALRAAALEGRKPGSVRDSLTASTIEDLTPDYLEWVRLHRTKQTYREREYTMRYINAIIGNVPVLAFNDHHISLYQKSRNAQGVSNKTINKELYYVLGFLRWARDEKGLDVRAVKMKKLPYARPIPLVLSPGEVARILEAAPPFYRAFFLALYSLGLRFTEARTLRWSDIDFENNSVRCIQKGGAWKILPLSGSLKAALKVLEGRNESDYVFYSQRSKGPIVNVRKAIKNACVAAKIAKHVSPHLFRHSVATHLMGGGPICGSSNRC